MSSIVPARSVCRVVLGGAMVLLCAGWGAGARASVIDTTTVVVGSCATGAGTASNCADTGYISTTTANATTSFIGGSIGGADPATVDFTSAFNSWNAANGDQWTLVNGGNLDVQLTVNATVGSAGSGSSGLSDIIVTLGNFVQGNGPSEQQLVWTQGLAVNYAPGFGMTSPFTTLDTYSLSAGSSGSGGAFQSACEALPGQTPGANNTSPSIVPAVTSGKAYCDPIYPFQYGSEYSSVDGVATGTDFFYDAPQAPWPDGGFRGVSLLSTITFGTNAAGTVTSRTLTVYQGVSYGFNLATNSSDPNGSATLARNLLLQEVPEPGALAMLALGLPVLGLLRRRPG